MLPIKVSQITKYFGEKLVLDKVDLAVKQGQIFGFIGLNGTGKTTLIKIMLDLLDEDLGEVQIFGMSKILPQSRKKLFYLPEKFSPSQYLKGEEFLKFCLNFHGLQYDKSKAEALCRNLDFDYKMLSYEVTKYSKGMTQKLGLIAVFLSQADLVILDEPMSGLDAKARINLKQELLSYKKAGKTVFFSSHILLDMDEICDEIAVLNCGKIVFSGLPQDFKKLNGEDSLEKAFLRQIS